MLLYKRILLVVCSCCCLLAAAAQDDTAFSKPIKVAVFAPVYLDSAFSGDVYKLGMSNLPRYLLPGLDFYNGMMLAIDSLNADKANVEVVFYDSKSIAVPIETIVNDSSLSGTSLIVASFNNRNEIRPLADYAFTHNVPLISATYPNDAGLTDNPFFILLNPTLRTHCEGIFKYLQRNYPTNNLILFKRKGYIEDMILSTFNELNRATGGIPLKIKTVELEDNFPAYQVTDYLDSTRQNVVICGSVDETFGINLITALDEAKSFSSVAIGMPTWDALKELDKGVEIIYSTPYNYQRTDKLGIQFTSKYRAKYVGRPSDMAFKGFEMTYHFTRLLIKHGSDFMAHLSDKDFKLFNDFDIHAMKADKTSVAPDYLENKKLYFIRKMDGQIRSVN